MLGTQFKLKGNTSVIYQLSETWGCRKKREALSCFRPWKCIQKTFILFNEKHFSEEITITLSIIILDLFPFEHIYLITDFLYPLSYF